MTGQSTSGDGIGNSYATWRFPVMMGLNVDGFSNAEMGTQPDIVIMAKNIDDRLQKLIEIIKSK